jgi:hypothetical protein
MALLETFVPRLFQPLLSKLIFKFPKVIAMTVKKAHNPSVVNKNIFGFLPIKRATALAALMSVIE